MVDRGEWESMEDRVRVVDRSLSFMESQNSAQNREVECTSEWDTEIGFGYVAQWHRYLTQRAQTENSQVFNHLFISPPLP